MTDNINTIEIIKLLQDVLDKVDMHNLSREDIDIIGADRLARYRVEIIKCLGDMD